MANKACNGILIVGDCIRRLVIASCEDEWVGDSIDMESIVVGREKFDALCEVSEDNDFGAPYLYIREVSLPAVYNIDRNLFDEIAAEDIESFI